MNAGTAAEGKKTYFSPIFYIREYFFPAGCGGCGEALLTPKDAYYGLCEDCREFFAAAVNGEKRCPLCGKLLISENSVCLLCREHEAGNSGVYNEYFQKLQALFPYTGKFRKILGSYKFGASRGIGNFLAVCLRTASGRFDFETAGECAWVPVPPRPGKIKKQGWDQIEYLAVLLERENRKKREKRAELPGSAGNYFPVRRCLKRLPSRSQKELNREERGSNLTGRIRCVKPAPKTAIVFDDVITTGATLNACAAALMEGGAEKVYGVCLFYD